MPSWHEGVYVPSFGDVSQLSASELKALVLARSGGDKTSVPFELSELRGAAEAACLDALDVETSRALVTRAGLSHKDCNTRETLRKRCAEACRRLREYEIPFRPPKKTTHRDTAFPVTWRKFDVTFREASLGFSIALDRGGNLNVVRSGDGSVAAKSGVTPGDALVALNHCGFGDISDVAAFEADVLQRLKKAPRPLKLTFQIGDGRWPPTAAGKQRPPPPPPQHKEEVDLRFRERGTLGFSIHLTEKGRLEVVKVRETAKSPCWLACVGPGDELVKLNGRAFGVVGADVFDDVVRQLKSTPRPMTLSFARRASKRPSSTPQPAPLTKGAAPRTSTTRQSSTKTFTRPTASTSTPEKTRPVSTYSFTPPSTKFSTHGTTTTAKPPAPPPPPSRPPVKHQDSAASLASASSSKGIQEETKTEPCPPPRSPGEVYKYEAVFPKALLGIALALSRCVETGDYHVAVTEVRPACVAAEVEAHDRLVAINGEAVTGVENERDFNTKILAKLKALPRPLTLTFTSGDSDNDVCFSQAYASDLFDDIDANQDGLLSQVELIKALRKNPELAKALDLPQIIRQEDGSRDQFTVTFHKLANKDGDKTITKRQWCVGISKLAAETII